MHVHACVCVCVCVCVSMCVCMQALNMKKSQNTLSKEGYTQHCILGITLSTRIQWVVHAQGCRCSCHCAYFQQGMLEVVPLAPRVSAIDGWRIWWDSEWWTGTLHSSSHQRHDLNDKILFQRQQWESIPQHTSIIHVHVHVCTLYMHVHVYKGVQCGWDLECQLL